MSTDIDQGGRESLNALVVDEIRAWLGRRRMSQTELARRLGVNVMWVRRRLAGAPALDLVDLQRIAAALAVEVARLLPDRLRPVRPTNGRSPRRYRHLNRRPQVKPRLGSARGLDRTTQTVKGSATHAHHP